MQYDKDTRTFHGNLEEIPLGKKVRLATVEINCGDLKMASFKVSISLSSKGNPQITVRAKKPKTGEFKSKVLMAIPEEID